MTGESLLLGLALVFPILMLLACLTEAGRRVMPSLIFLAPLPALAAALFAGGSSFALPTPFTMTLALDRPGSILLGVAALLWVAAGFYAPIYWRETTQCTRFAVWWLLTLTGSIGVFIADDMVTFYLLFSLVSLSAYGLIVLDGTSSDKRAGLVYTAFAVLGEAFLLAAFVLLSAATPNGTLVISEAVQALSGSPWRDVTVLLLILGFAIKMGLVPLHVWMPLTYSAAPAPAAAVLSGAAVKAGVIGLIRFLPFGAGMAGWGDLLIVVGLFSAFYGVAIGITQKNPKAVLAYSSISQMGVIATVLGMGLTAGQNVGVETAFYAAHHILAKGGLFLAIGVVAATGPRRLWSVWIPAAILALGMGGLPFTGGALAKLAVKDVLGYGFVGTLSAFSAAGSTLLMLHFLMRLRASASTTPEAVAPRRMVLTWWVVAFAAVALPWILYPTIDGSLAAIFKLGDLWAATWPVLIGAALAFALQRYGNRLPDVPPGDILVLGESSIPAVQGWSDRFERAEAFMRRWPVAGVMLLSLAIVFGAAMLTGR